MKPNGPGACSGKTQEAGSTPVAASTLAFAGLLFQVLSGFIPVRTFALGTDAGFYFALRIAGNPLMQASPAPEAPDCNFNFRHTWEYTARIILLASSILLDKYIPLE